MAGLTPEMIELNKKVAERMARVKHSLVVISGKGGVGKTTVSVNLAVALAMKDYRVGILDIDFHGPNIAKMLGIEGEILMNSSEGIEPFPVLPNLKALSMALLIQDQDEPIIWRGPLKMGTMRQFLGETNWGELDYLIIDSPPGTGDEPLSAIQLLPKVDGVVIVTTPQAVAVLDSRKTIKFAEKLNVPVIGVIENMSGLACPHCGETIDLFGRGGGEKAAGELGVPFLGAVPLDPEMVARGDGGRPPAGTPSETPSGQALADIVDKIRATVEQ